MPETSSGPLGIPAAGGFTFCIFAIRSFVPQPARTTTTAANIRILWGLIPKSLQTKGFRVHMAEKPLRHKENA